MDLQRRNWAFREKGAFVLRIAGLSKCSGPQRSRPPCVGRKVEATEPPQSFTDSQLVGSIPPYTSLAISFFYYFVRKSYENTVGVHPAL